jgi:exodeoxyribonuclease III
MKIISWNVNGINSVTSKGAMLAVQKENADVYCFQEVKATKEKIPQILSGYKQYHSHAQKKGYSGVSTFSKEKPLSVIDGIGESEFDSEGRIITTEFSKFFLINAYFPNSNRELTRLGFKLRFNDLFLKFCKRLEEIKPLIITGDFNVAHEDIDIAHPRSNDGNAGFTKEEREWFGAFLKNGFVDTFREFTKDNGHYTFWVYMGDARARNIGWRIDYFVVSDVLKNKVKSSGMLSNIMGSDHCPIVLRIE